MSVEIYEGNPCKVYTKYEENWKLHFQGLLEFREENKRFPTTLERQKEFAIGKWCNMQRVQKKNGILLPNREEQLEKIYFPWTPQKDAWLHRYELIAQFWKEHGHLPTSKENKSYVVWIQTQRNEFSKGLLIDEQIELLQKLGINLESNKKEEAWDRNYDCIKQFYQEHKRLPQFEEVYENGQKKIGFWLCDQRRFYRKGTLLATRQQKLEELGVIFGEKSDIVFKQNYNLLLEYLDQYNQMPNTKVIHNGFQLGLWCERVKADYENEKLSQEQINLLESIQFDFRKAGELKKIVDFDRNYKEYLDFYKRYGKRPTNKTSGKLTSWYGKLKKREEEGRLSVDMRDKFERIKVLE